MTSNPTRTSLLSTLSLALVVAGASARMQAQSHDQYGRQIRAADGSVIHQPLAPVAQGRLARAPARAALDLFQPYQAMATGAWPEAVAIGDVNHDGLNDVLLTCSSYGLVILYGKTPFVPAKLAITAPNGGETYEVGQSCQLTWNGGAVASTVTLEYSVNQGASWHTIGENIANSGSYTWVVPDAPSSACLLRVSGAGGAAQDVSDACFAIAPKRALTLKTPNGGEYWETGKPAAITWESRGLIARVDLACSVDGGATWTWVARSVANTGAYAWTVPNTVSRDGRVRVSDAEGTAFDTSDAGFTLGQPRTLTLSRPNGGEVIARKKPCTITWTSTGFIDKVKLEYTLDDGKSWKTLAASAPNTAQYLWTVPNTTTRKGRVRVTAIGGTATDASDGLFRIK